MTYLDPDTFMNNIKSCKFLKINDYHKSLPILPVPVRYKGGRGGGETVDKLREVWALEPGLGGVGGGGGYCYGRGLQYLDFFCCGYPAKVAKTNKYNK